VLFRSDIFGEKINVKILSGDHTSAAKRSFVKELGSGHVAAAGNGFNDVEMLEEAVLSIAVLEAEGCSPDILFKADIVVRSIDEAFMLLLKPKRLIATLRC